MQRVRWIF